MSLGGSERFFPLDPALAADRRKAVIRAARPLSAAVADELEAQNRRLAPSPAREANLAALRRGAAAVVTGQQVGLFLGPLYTLYKAASAVRIARALAEETGQPVVPVFWLQTEDHDLPEIASCEVPTPRGAPLALRLPASAEERISVAHRTLPGGVERCLSELRAELGHMHYAESHLARLERHYRPGAGWSEAFAGVLSELFAEEGLVFVDPRVPALAREAVAVHRRALEGAETIAASLLERSALLERAGRKPPVHVRAGAPLSFFHPNGATGNRYRLEAAAGDFAEIGGAGRHALAELLELLESEPLRFSTSALLRPILQDTLLPTAAYVGGPGEIAYFEQLAPLYGHYDLPMPLIVPRAKFRVIEPRAARLLAKLELRPDDLKLSLDELLSRQAGNAPSREELVRRLVAPFEEALAASGLAATDPAVTTALRKTRSSVARSVGRLADKYVAAQLRSDRARVADLERLKELLLPGDAPQERIYALPYFAAHVGERRFVELVLDGAVPFDGTPRDLHV